MFMLKQVFTAFAFILMGLSTPLFADSQSELFSELNECESYILEKRSHYKVEEKFDSVKTLPLKDWPVEIQRALYAVTHETVEVPLIVDSLHIASYQRQTHLGYSHGASIIRSAIVEKENERAYLAIYSAWAGEWGREKKHLEYFILDQDGKILRSGYSRD